MRIVVAGPQGSGKSTQAKLLAKHLGLPYICSGDLIRQEMAAQSNVGLRVQDQMMRGALVADEDVDTLIMTALEDASISGWVLDGYPRRMSQAIKLWQHHAPSRIVKLVLSIDNCRQRLAARGREDDTEEAVTERLTEYFGETTRAIDWLIRQWNYGDRFCTVIDANQTVDHVSEDIFNSLWSN
jgi:adenylate kinase